MTQLTYVAFHLLFVVPPLAALTVTATGRERRGLWAGIGVIVVVAVAYTTPWDNYLIARGVWWYADAATGVRVWHAPIEEYLFFVLQPILAGVWLGHLPHLGLPLRADRRLRDVSRRARVAGAVAGLAVAAVGTVMTFLPATFYLGALLAWAGPVLALQWAFGGPYLWQLRRTVALSVLPPALYLSGADRVALQYGVWSLAERYTTGLTVAGLPVEEGAFFVLTTLFVVQGLLLFLWVVDRWR